MIILFGGFKGSGRKILAQKVANRLGFYYYNLDSKKMREHIFNRDGSVTETIVQPHRNTSRERMFDLVLEELPLLAKMYTDVVIDDAFHRAQPRERFSKAAERYFGDLIFVWIDTDEHLRIARLAKMKKRGAIASVEYESRKLQKVEDYFEPFTNAPFTFRSRGIAHSNIDADELARILKTKMHSV